MTKKVMFAMLMSAYALSTQAQGKKSDTVKVSLANTSQVIFTMKDRSDLEILKHYDFQNLFKDILSKLEKNDSTKAPVDSTKQNTAATENNDEDWHIHDRRNDDERQDNDNHNDNDWHRVHWHKGRTSQSFNFDLGTNNYLSNGKFPTNAAEVRPWGSWYIGMSSIQRTRLAKKFFLEWGLGVSWYNFKFQDNNVMLLKDDNGVQFVDDPRSTTAGYSFTKSKLTATYINASLIPVIDFSDSGHKAHMWDGHGNSFRIGLGPYLGYRIDSYTKQVYSQDGDKKKEHNHDSFYLNNIRYGARLQIGYRSTDLFFNYDMNSLFMTGKGPSLNAFSFGVVF